MSRISSESSGSASTVDMEFSASAGARNGGNMEETLDNLMKLMQSMADNIGQLQQDVNYLKARDHDCGNCRNEPEDTATSRPVKMAVAKGVARSKLKKRLSAPSGVDPYREVPGDALTVVSVLDVKRGQSTRTCPSGIIMLCTYHFQLFYLPFAPSYYPDGSAGTTAINITLELVFLLNLLLNLNTAFMRQNVLVSSRRLIARNYMNRWFLLDLLSAIPLNGLQYLVTTRTTRVISQQETAFMTLRLLRVTFIERGVLLSRVVRIGKHLTAWFRYSRYSHLMGIAQLLWLVLLTAHYMACLWHVVAEQHVSEAKSVAERYVADYYYAVSLIHGQGNPIGSRDEDLFSSIAIIVGSVILAIVFGNVAMLVSNFNANTTNYHRKMEAVFGTVNKMNLPEKLRERIHQYYAHVWAEYESLDGDVVKFQRELTHSLSLEVGLYKYMNLVTEIPFWKDCSPDFATQIILNLAVRVYLPDDYVVR
ncbi:hypothetical protein BBJ28_00013910, partial [Nothophytophthora sp. Chile5]